MEKVKNIRPYFDYLGDLDAVTLWNICEKRGWVEYAKAELEPLLRVRNSEYVNKFLRQENVERAELDHDLTSAYPERFVGWNKVLGMARAERNSWRS